MRIRHRPTPKRPPDSTTSSQPAAKTAKTAPTNTKAAEPTSLSEPYAQELEQAVSPWDKDAYARHDPTPLRFGQVIDKQLDKVAKARTHERVMTDVSGSFFGVSVGFTLSQLDLVKKATDGVEIIHVVNGDGSSNIESVLGRVHLSKGQRIELQGPAFNTSVTPGELPVGCRFVGVGLTSDVTSAMDHDAVSYTVEVKLTEKSVVELAALVTPGAAAAAAAALSEVAGSGVAAVIGDAVLGAVPLLSAGLAVNTMRRTWHVLHDDTASREMKAFAVAHTVGDTVRVFLPMVGTLINAGLVGVAAALGWVHWRHAKHAAPSGPPPEAAQPPGLPPPP